MFGMQRLISQVEGLRAAIESASTADGGEPVAENRPELDASGAAVTSKGHKGYYFFDSKGKRLPNKWYVCNMADCDVDLLFAG